MTLIAAGWLYYGLSSQATLRFNPIDVSFPHAAARSVPSSDGFASTEYCDGCSRYERSRRAFRSR